MCFVAASCSFFCAAVLLPGRIRLLDSGAGRCQANATNEEGGRVLPRSRQRISLASSAPGVRPRHVRLTSTYGALWHLMASVDDFQFNPLTTRAVELQQLLRDGKITSVEIVQQYLKQIDRHEHVLNSFISIAPRDRLLRAAASLDEERLRGASRGALHGIPIVLKVNISNRSASFSGLTFLGQLYHRI
jgi:hypothetical protein